MSFWRNANGSASIEFVAAGLLLLVPLVYLVYALSLVQAATLAVEGGSRHAVRVFVQAASEPLAFSRARLAVDFAMADAHVTNRTTTTVRCQPVPTDCLVPASRVTVTVATHVSLPFIPAIFGIDTAFRVPISASSTELVSRFHGGGSS